MIFYTTMLKPKKEVVGLYMSVYSHLQLHSSTDVNKWRDIYRPYLPSNYSWSYMYICPGKVTRQVQAGGGNTTHHFKIRITCNIKKTWNMHAKVHEKWVKYAWKLNNPKGFKTLAEDRQAWKILHRMMVTIEDILFIFVNYDNSLHYLNFRYK